MIVSNATIAAELAKFSPRSVELVDAQYFCPSLSWIREFCDWMTANRHPYKSERYDCDNFSRWAAAAADEAIYSRDDLGDVAHTFGVIDLWLKGNGVLGIVPPEIPGIGRFGGHSTNIVRLNDNIYYLVEPQTSKFAPLADLGDGIGAIYGVRL